MTEKRTPESYLPLTPATLHILLALGDGPCHGYAIMKAVERRSEGYLRLGPGSLYGTLKKLLDERLIAEDPPSSDSSRRRAYRLTELGKRVAGLESGRLASLLEWARSSRLVEGTK